jgi:hypothetical protein
MAKLIVHSGTRAGQEIELKEHSLIIGSSPDNQILLTDPGINPSHASLDFRNERWVLQDLGSPGGTLVNNEPVEGTYRLSEGELIQVAGVELEIRGIGPQPLQAGQDTTAQLPQAPVVIPATESAQPTPIDARSEQSRVNPSLLAIIGGGLLAVVAIGALTVFLAGGALWFRTLGLGDTGPSAGDQGPDAGLGETPTSATDRNSSPVAAPATTRPAIEFFRCSPACAVDQGTSVLLEWTVQSATEVYLNEKIVALSGQQLITPSSTITYELRALNNSDQVTRTLQISVQ